MTTTIETLAAQWLDAKHDEARAVEARRIIEDQMSEALAFEAQSESTTTAKVDGYTIKIAGRLTRKVDADLIQELAAEHGLNNLLTTVCRWKPELEIKAWKALSDEHRAALSKAITTTAGRPSFAITAITKE